MVNYSLPGFVFAAAFVAFAPMASAANDVSIAADQAKIVDVSGQPGTVVVGNPNIADVTVKGDQVVLFGRNYGVTNVIILDRQGKQLATLDVTVQYPHKNAVQLFKAGVRTSYVCDPVCDQPLQVGDDYGTVFKDLQKETDDKGKLASGSAKGE